MASGSKTQDKHVIVTMGKHGVLVGSINLSERVLEEIEHDDKLAAKIWGYHTVHGCPIGMVHLPGAEVAVTNCTGAGTIEKPLYGLLLSFLTVFGYMQVTAWSVALCTVFSMATMFSRAAILA